MDERFRGVPDTPAEVGKMLQGVNSGYGLIIEPILLTARTLVDRHEAGANHDELEFHINSLREDLKGQQ